MACAIRTHVSAAGFAVDESGDFRVNRRQKLPALLGSSRHDRGPLERAFFAAGYAHSKVADSSLRQSFLAALRVGPQRVASIDDDVPLLKKRKQLFDDSVHGCTRLDHDLCFSGAFERLHEILKSVGGDDVFALCPALREFLGDRRGAVINGHSEPLALHVENEVFTHYSEADQADITIGGHWFLYS